MQPTKSQYLLLQELRSTYAKGPGEIPSPLSRKTVQSVSNRHLPYAPWHRAVRDLNAYVTATGDGRYRVKPIPDLSLASLPGDWPIGIMPPPSDAVFTDDDDDEPNEPAVPTKTKVKATAPPVPTKTSARRSRVAKAPSKPDPGRLTDSSVEQEDRILADVVALQEGSVSKVVAPKVLAELFDSLHPCVDRRLWKDRNRRRGWIASRTGFGGTGLTTVTKNGLQRLSERAIVSRMSDEDRERLLAHDPRLKYVKPRRAA